MKEITLNDQQSIQEYLDLGYLKINLEPGKYYQKIVIKNDNTIISGKNASETIIYFDDYANKIHQDSKEYNTFRTYTVLVSANNVSLLNLTITNTALEPKIKGQAVALSVNKTNFIANNLILESLQDTLFLGPLPLDLQERYQNFLNSFQLSSGYCKQKFINCTIKGSVDFIFGGGDALFKDCQIVSLNDNRDIGYVSAPAQIKNSNSAFYFLNCNFISDSVKGKNIFLSRPWREDGICYFIDCILDKHINPKLFSIWQNTERHLHAKYYYYNLKLIKIEENFGIKLEKNQKEQIIQAIKEKFQI